LKQLQEQQPSLVPELKSLDKILETASSNDATDNMMLAYLNMDKDYGDFPVLRVLPPSYERSLLPVLQLGGLTRMAMSNTGATRSDWDRTALMSRTTKIVDSMRAFSLEISPSTPLDKDAAVMVERERLFWLERYCSPPVIHKYDVRLTEGSASAQQNHTKLTRYLLPSQLWTGTFRKLHTDFLTVFDAKLAAKELEAGELAEWVMEQAQHIAREHSNQREQLLSEARVLYMTNDAAIMMSTSAQRSSMPIAHTLFDEVAFSMAPTTLLLIAATKGRRVLVGDEKQLPVVVKHPLAIKAGLGCSIFKAIADIFTPSANRAAVGSPDLSVSVHSLTKQYRMDQKIGEYISRRFYSNQLLSMSRDLGTAVVISPPPALASLSIQGRSFLRHPNPFKKLLPGQTFVESECRLTSSVDPNTADWTTKFTRHSTLNTGEARTVSHGSSAPGRQLSRVQ